MSDPTRLLDQMEDVTEDERRALAAGRDVRPPQGFSGDVWGALALELPPTGSLDPTGGGSAGAGGSLGSGAGTSAAGTAGAKVALSMGGAAGAKIVGGVGLVSIVKAAALGAVVGTAVITGRAVVSSSSPSAKPVAESHSAEPTRLQPAPGIFPSIREVEKTPALEPGSSSPSEGANVEPSQRGPSLGESGRARVDDRGGARHADPPVIRAEPVAAPPTSMPEEWAGDGRAESRLVAAARDALRLGDPASGLAWLERARREFPNGVLVQEREALTIEALVASGRRAEAEKRAADFLRDYPKSPHSARVQAIVR